LLWRTWRKIMALKSPTLGLSARPEALDTLIRTHAIESQHRIFIYEAGPVLLALSLSAEKDSDCWVVAPSLIPRRLGIGQTDRVTPCNWPAWPVGGSHLRVCPTVDDEALRDLTRHAKIRSAISKTPKFRLKAFVLRQDIRYAGRANWGPAPPLALCSRLSHPGSAHRLFKHTSVPSNEHTERSASGTRTPRARQSVACASVVDALQALRGVQCTVAITMVAAIGDLTRFDNQAN